MSILQLLWFPFLLVLIYSCAVYYRSTFLKDAFYQKYFIPAMSLKIFGSLSLTLIYQFYYGYGDIFLYYQGGAIIFDGFGDSFSEGWKLLTDMQWMRYRSSAYSDFFHYYVTGANYNVMRITGVIALLGLNNLYAISLVFATFSFLGIWVMYTTFVKINPSLYKEFAIACFFLPSVFFWGSGILKDSITISALGWVFWGFYNIVIRRKNIILSAAAFALGSVVLMNIKYYILFSFLPALLYWAVNEYQASIRHRLVRVLSTPFFLFLAFALPMIGIVNLMGSTDLTLDRLVYQSLYQKEHLEYAGAGSAYSLGEFDESLSGLLTIAPKAIFLALFRPFIWEIRNPFMLLSALECLFFLYMTFRVFKEGFKNLAFITAFRKLPVVRFIMIFTLVFAAGVGLSSGNFGTLARYKIPFMPFYLAGLFMMISYIRKKRRSLIYSQVPRSKRLSLQTMPEEG